MTCPPAFDLFSFALGVVGTFSLLAIAVLIAFWFVGRAGTSAAHVE